ncbi:RHS repeat-associated core domain-containing protein [Actinokineospora sp. UTMC 2448]|uniref:RHS repeat-associated core domain-containing protein n=1 Tax=Actinokineospora sp. UTMC 2448 TaxID=2268449 RepID=UPI002164115D|nr:RHS repeat-associated core domain-containing protein [Actinokineospora sp. UTMC 2448]UVS81292.1 Cell wall-associated polypeptide [Actinokineospora sp. UTMC 2448]
MLSLRRGPLRAVTLVAAASLLATVPQLLAPGAAAAVAGPSVPGPEIPSVGGTTTLMAPRPIDQASQRALSGDQPASAAKDGGGMNTATSLAPSSSWEVSLQTGDFTWSYPMRVPPAPGGLEPAIALNYRSSAVDGRTSATNNQPSWVGDGWDLSSGFIERSYGACANDDMGGTVPPKTGDLCWRSDNATAAFPGGGGMLIRDDHTGEWRTRTDDGSRVERRTGAANGARDGEYWSITTVDGTQYLFGSQASSGSTWTVPVFGDDENEPCHAATFEASRCTQAWRWNLDKIIDRNGNVIRYYYRTETNAYGLNMEDTAVSYIRGGTLERIEYGLRENDAAIPPSGRVEFAVSDRCVKGSTCTLDRKANWPDTPLDDRCDTATCPDRHSPTFWTTKRLSSVTTYVRRGTGFEAVDRWTLRQDFPTPSDDEPAALWLSGVQHKGMVGGEASLPEVTFEGKALANRVEKVDGVAPLNRYRLVGIVSESGGVTSISYAGPNCVAGSSMPANPETNTLRCFPQKWTKKDFAERTDYFHKYVVESVTNSDRLSTSTQQVTSYEYLDGAAWHWDTSEFVDDEDKTWNEFRGFARVRVRTGDSRDPSGPVTLTESRFHRGMDKDRLPSGARSVTVTDSEGGSRADSDWLAGFGYESTAYNGAGGGVVSKTITTPWVAGPTATRGPFKAHIVRQGTQRTYTALASGGWRTTAIETAYDDRGIPTTTDDLGDLGSASDDRCTRTGYVRGTGKWLLNLPSTVETVAVKCDATPVYPQDVINASRMSYDGQAAGAAPTSGNLTRMEIATSRPASGAVYLTKWTGRYDQHGRVVESTDAAGQTTKTAYTPAVGGPLTSTAETSPTTLSLPAGLVTVTHLEPAWGLVTKLTDANGRFSESTYDPLGRRTETWLPDRPKAEFPNGTQKWAYHIRKDQPSVIVATKVGPNGNYTSSHTLYDGLLRPRQIQTPAVGGGRTIVDTRYDSHGRPYKKTQPYFNDAPIDLELFEASDVDVPGLNRVLYDGAGRAVAAVFQSGAIEKWRTTTAYEGDRVHVTPPPGGTPTTTISDARGQTVELRQYHGPAPTGAFDSTTYQYTAAGQLSQMRDPAGNRWTYEYDLRGRVVRSQDPDKGVVEFTHDVMDRVVTSTDSRGAIVAMTYDELGRRTSTRLGSPTGTKLAEWTFDTVPNAKGHPATSTRWTDGSPYTTKISSYDPMYRPIGVWTTIPAAEGALANTYKAYTSYGPDGSVSGMSYPKSGDLNAETVNYVHDDNGLLLSSSGSYNGTVELVTATTYTRYGELETMQLGTGAKRAWASYYYETDTRRLARTIVDAEVPNPKQSDVSYAYNAVGNVMSIAEAVTGDKQCFRYDHQRRLTEAWTPTAGCDSAPSATALGGPAPYWHSYTYDLAGNRVSEVQHKASGDTTHTYTYPPAGQPQPHSLQSVTTTGASPSTTTYEYDDAGNTTNRTIAGVGETLTWDAEGRVSTITKDGKTTRFVYGADGERLLRKDPSGTTLYLMGQEIRLNAGSTTPTCTRYYTYGDRTIAVRQGATLTWMFSDHQATGHITINASTLAVTRRSQLPFGGTRGTPPPIWPGDKGFVGGAVDPTGLLQVGARQYDPSTGRFLSVDPILDDANPNQWNPYAYAGNSPITWSDPTGLIWGWLDVIQDVKDLAESISDSLAATGSGNPYNRTSKHNAVQKAAARQITWQANMFGFQNVRVYEGMKIDDASKRCLDMASLVRKAGCTPNFGYADIVLAVTICPEVNACYDHYYVWEVKAIGANKKGSVAQVEAQWYADNLINWKENISASPGWVIGGPYKDVLKYPKTNYWGIVDGEVAYADDGDRRMKMDQWKQVGLVEEFDIENTRWERYVQTPPTPPAPPEPAPVPVTSQAPSILEEVLNWFNPIPSVVGRLPVPVGRR